MNITITAPEVPYPGGTSHADFMRQAADRLEGGRYAVGGRNVTATVVALLREVAATMDATELAPAPKVVGYMAIGDDGQFGNFRGPRIRGTVAAVEEQLASARGGYWRIAEVRELPGTTAGELAERRGEPGVKPGDRLRALTTYRSITGDRIVEGETYEVRALDRYGLPILNTDKPGSTDGWLPGQLEPIVEENVL